MTTLCPVCCNAAPVGDGGQIERHPDGNGGDCVMSGKQAPAWDERGTREAVRNRSGSTCEFCQRARATEMHHRKSRGVGGRWNPGNIVHLCSACHRKATENHSWARALGLVVTSKQDPEKVPVMRENWSSFQPTSGVLKPRPAGL